MIGWHLAQMNVGTTVEDVDSPTLAAFMARLDSVNALADAAPGFIWRLQTSSGNATDIRPSEDPRFIINMSVWEGVEPLFAFVYRTAHRDVMVRRREWFLRPAGAHQVLWWLPAGQVPTVEQGLARLRLLDAEGPTPAAFTFRAVFPPPIIPPARDLAPEPIASAGGSPVWLQALLGWHKSLDFGPYPGVSPIEVAELPAHSGFARSRLAPAADRFKKGAAACRKPLPIRATLSLAPRRAADCG